MKDKILVITGGTGSFGNAVLKRYLKTDLNEIRIFSRDEKKQDDMRQHYNDPKIKYYIGDVRNRRTLEQVMKGADYVFHAAALKQVPSCEFFPVEAVQTNVLGCENVLDAAIANGVKRVIVLSTDKAVYPVNAMVLSKALSEKVMIAKSRNLNGCGTVLCGTRYGNVMGSRGSVIPLFIDQIKAGRPLTITDPEMTRFMMTLDEAVDLVMYAFKNATNGDIFVQKAPAATINVLAKAIMSIYPDHTEIKIIGTRHGEKLFETLVTREEMIKAEDMGRFYRIPADTRDLNYGMFFTDGKTELTGMRDYTSHNTEQLGIDEMKKVLLKLDLIQQDLESKSKKEK